MNKKVQNYEKKEKKKKKKLKNNCHNYNLIIKNYLFIKKSNLQEKS